jgi:DNA-binding NarL/FixJ family response regulator
MWEPRKVFTVWATSACLSIFVEWGASCLKFLAEGNVRLRKLIKALIETRSEFLYAVKQNGVEAISKAVKLKPDVVILDFAMTGLNGLQVGTQLSNTYPDLRIILHTFHAFSEMISQARKSGIQEVVSKGEHGNTLPEAIDRCGKNDSAKQSTPTVSTRQNDQPSEPSLE